MKTEDKAVTNKEADASIESLEVGNVVPACDFPHFCDVPMAGIDQTGSAINSTQVRPAELRFLRAVVDHPMRRSSEYSKLAGISPNTLQKIRPGLVERGFIRENKLETSSRGRAAVLLEPLEPARQLVGNREE